MKYCVVLSFIQEYKLFRFDEKVLSENLVNGATKKRADSDAADARMDATVVHNESNVMFVPD